MPRPRCAIGRRWRKLPDFSGVWTPVISDQVAQEKSNPPPWNPKFAKQIEHMYAEEKGWTALPNHRSLAFRPDMPSYMLITHNAFELLATPAG